MKINEALRVVKGQIFKNIYIIKKVDKRKFIVISSLMVVPGNKPYKALSAHVAALLYSVILVTYFISKMSKPIELLKKCQKCQTLIFQKLVLK